MDKRGSGILLHITSLPSAYGIGDLGKSAYDFADFLYRSKQTFWQVLPLTPTNHVFGNSPYSSFSAFAGNKALISPDVLLEEGLISKEDLEPLPKFPDHYCDYEHVVPYKEKILHNAYRHFKQKERKSTAFFDFCSAHKHWLDDFATFVVLKTHLKGQPWYEWPDDLKNRVPSRMAAVQDHFKDEIEYEKFLQYRFYRQWFALKKYCNERYIHIIGDIPIYVDLDSSDVWAHQHLFKLDENSRPTVLSGVPPDYFSATGQLWGNPIYRWDVLREQGYSWWIDRMEHNMLLFDIVKVDHFRGFIAYWEVPAGSENAVNGTWVDVPYEDFFGTLKKRFYKLPMLAEDLGTITPDVKEVLYRLQFMCMKVLLFAFGEDFPHSPYLPHRFSKNYIVYTGTHDNNTLRGWLDNELNDNQREKIYRYIGNNLPHDTIHWEFIRLAMMSVANIAIFPLQDVLGLGAEARMNIPSTGNGNWQWRMTPCQITDEISNKLAQMCEIYERT